MALKYLLDTSVYCQPIKKKPLESVKSRWLKLKDSQLAISIITQAEVLQGLEMSQSTKLLKAYQEILSDRLTVIQVDERVAIAYAQYAAYSQKKGQPRSAFDLLIAATARAYDLTLATCNYKDFVNLPELAVENWLEEAHQL